MASPLPEDKAAQARQRVRRNAQRKGRTPSEASLFAAGFVILVTNLPASTWNTHLVFQLYRIRWQVELLFKRLKSLLCLDGLRAKDPSLSKVYLMGKLLAALLLDGVTQAATLICPQWFASLDRPVSIWRLTTLFQDAFRSLIRGYVPLIQVFFLLPKLQRYLCLSPRKRRQQLVWARDLLVSSVVC